jgi:hypothetical protein
MKMTFSSSAGVILFLVASQANALPAYSRLHQAKYGYRPSCKLCHTSGGGSAVTDYGRDFLRAGANMGAFAKIENKDSDSDGILNIDEIKAKSNAGDPRSIPAKSGDWLASANETFIPQENLKPLFPSADSYAAIEGTLKPEQVSAVEKRVGKSLGDDDKVPTFYFAIKDGKRFGVAQFVAATTPSGIVSIAVAMDTKATITGVRILKNAASKAIEDPVFLSQFAGKKLDDAIQIGADLKAAPNAESDSKEVAVAVKKAVAIINAVFAKQSAMLEKEMIFRRLAHVSNIVSKF